MSAISPNFYGVKEVPQEVLRKNNSSILHITYLNLDNTSLYNETLGYLGMGDFSAKCSRHNRVPFIVVLVIVIVIGIGIRLLIIINFECALNTLIRYDNSCCVDNCFVFFDGTI